MRARVAVAAGALTLAGLGVLQEPATAALAWGPCSDPSLAEAGAQCAVVNVPADHAKPNGPTIPIAVSRIAATASKSEYLGPLVGNPGGPGVPGLGESRSLLALLPQDVSSRFDLIGFDPRGVGASGPDLSCDPSYFKAPAPDYRPPDPGRVTGSELQRKTAAANYVKACQTKNGEALKHQRTIDAAKDLDLIRAALGAEQISYLGNSYGTYLGAVYASTFPKNVGRMVLTGVVPPDGVGYTGDVARPAVAKAYERNVDAFFAWVAEHANVYNLGSDAKTVEARYYDDLNALALEPHGQLGPAEWTAIFALAAYGDDSWAALAQAWSAWAAGRTAIFDQLAAGADAQDSDDYNASYLSIACSDGQWPRNYDRLRKDTLKSAQDAPFIAWAFHWELSALCATWPVHNQPVKVGGATPMLLVNATYDAPTPLADALATRNAFPNSALIEVKDALGHAGRSLWGNSCVEAPVANYLLTGQLPTRQTTGPDAQCERLPGPDYPDIALALAGEVLATLEALLAAPR